MIQSTLPFPAFLLGAALHAVETVTSPGGLTYLLKFRADDGCIAFRYGFEGKGAKNLTAESTGFTLSPGAQFSWQGGSAAYENIYRNAGIESIADGAA